MTLLILRTLTAAALVAAAHSAASGTAPRTTAQGVYTENQARRGLAVHEQYCAKCHRDSYFQGSFLLPWRDQPVSALYDLIALKMPEDRPGALQPREYAALLAYVFALNGLPAGEETLSHDHDALHGILITDE